MPNIDVDIEVLGKCDDCGLLASTKDVLAEDMDVVERRCFVCNAILTHESFGFANPEDRRKIRWISPDGNWTNVRPSENFDLGEIRVNVDQCPLL